jgi:hypothetical protein
MCAAVRSDLLWLALGRTLALGSLACAAGTRWAVPFTAYAFCGVGSWLTHWVGHQPASGWWFRFHILGHHVRRYPPSRFLQGPYDDAALDLNACMYAPWVLLTAATHAAGGCAPHEQLTAAGVSAALLLEQEVLHTQIHLLGSSLERCRWFRTLRQLHLRHHQCDMQHNFAISDFLLDAICGTLLLT